MRRYVTLLLLIGIGLVVQSSFSNIIEIFGVKPDLILLLVVFNAFLQGPREGAFFGLLAGIIHDMFLGRYIGLNALSKFIVGFFLGFLGKKFYKDSIFLVIIFTFVASMINDTIFLLLSLFLNLEIDFWYGLVRIVLPAAFYNTLLVPIFYGKFYRSTFDGWLNKKI